jgi:acetylglutamate kinase
MDKLQIVKIGGNVIENRKALHEFLKDFAQLKEPKILVHGGGKEATQMAFDLGVPVQMIEGRRVTDAANLEIITMLYAGKINKTIVSSLQGLDCNVLGLSGADGNSILADKRPSSPIDFGFVGDLTQVNTAFFRMLLENQITPVCCAISHDGKGQLLNTNADTIAAKLAVALSSFFKVTLSYCFEKKGVLENIEDKDSVIEELTPSYFDQLKSNGKIHSGMLPKIENAFEALDQGVDLVCIGSPKMIIPDESFTKITLSC